MTKFTKFDAADYLTDGESIAAYLNEALEDEDPSVFLMAISTAARAQGMSQIANESGLGRESLYKALSSGAKPRYETVVKVIRALGVKLHAEAA